MGTLTCHKDNHPPKARTIQTGLCIGCGQTLGAIANGTTTNAVTTWHEQPYCDTCINEAQ